MVHGFTDGLSGFGNEQSATAVASARDQVGTAVLERWDTGVVLPNSIAFRAGEGESARFSEIFWPDFLFRLFVLIKHD